MSDEHAVTAFTSSVVDALDINKLEVRIISVEKVKSRQKTYQIIGDGIVVLFELSFSTGVLGTSSPQVAVDAVSKRYNDQVASGNYSKILQVNAKMYNSTVMSSSYSTASDVVVSTTYQATVLHTSKPSLLPSGYPTKQPSQQPFIQPSSHPSLSKVSIWEKLLRTQLKSAYTANQDIYYRLSVENSVQLVPNSWTTFVTNFLKVATKSSNKNIVSLSAVEVNDARSLGLSYFCSDHSKAVSIVSALTDSTTGNVSIVCGNSRWNVNKYANLKSFLSVGPRNSSVGSVIRFYSSELQSSKNVTADGLSMFVVQYSIDTMSGYPVLYSLVSIWFVILVVWAVNDFNRKSMKKQKNLAVVQPWQSDSSPATIQAKLLEKLDSIFVGVFSNNQIHVTLYAAIINCSAYLKPFTCTKRSHSWGYCLYLSVRASIILLFVVLLMRNQYVPYSEDCSRQQSEQDCRSFRSSSIFEVQSCVWRGRNEAIPSVGSMKPCIWIDTAAEATAASIMKIIIVSLLIALSCRVFFLDILLQRVILASIRTADAAKNQKALSLLTWRSISKRKIVSFESLRSKFSSKEESTESVSNNADGEGNDIRRATRVHNAASFASGIVEASLKTKIKPIENLTGDDPEMQDTAVTVEKEFGNLKSDLVNCSVVMRNSHAPDLSRFLEHWALDEKDSIEFDRTKFTRRNLNWMITNGHVTQSAEEFFMEYVAKVVEDSRMLTDNDVDLLRLFVFDLIGRYSASATILQHTMDMATNESVHLVRKEMKVLGFAIMAAINGYILALSISFSASMSSAWITTTMYALVAALLVDVVICDFIWTLWTSLLLPLSIAGNVYRIKSEVRQYIGSLVVKYTYSAPADDILDIPVLGSSSSERFNAAKHFFISSRLARDKPTSAERDLVMSYETIFPTGIDAEDWVQVDEEAIIFIGLRSFYHMFIESLQAVCQLNIFLQQIFITLLVYAVIYGSAAGDSGSFTPLNIGIVSAVIASIFLTLYAVNNWPRYCRKKPSSNSTSNALLPFSSPKKEDDVSTAKVLPIITKAMFEEVNLVAEQPPTPHHPVAPPSSVSSSPVRREFSPMSADSNYKTSAPSVYDLSDSDEDSVKDLILHMRKSGQHDEDSDASDHSRQKMSIRPFSPLEKIVLVDQHPPPAQLNGEHLERKLFELKDSFMNSSSESSLAHSSHHSGDLSQAESNDVRSRISVSTITASSEGDSFSDDDSGSDYYSRRDAGGRIGGGSSVSRSTTTSSKHNTANNGDLASVNPALKYYPLSDSSESRRSSSGDDSLST